MELNERIELYGNELGLNPEDFDYEKSNAEANYSVGFDDGEVVGEKRGKKLGRKQGLLETAKNMLINKEPIEKIIKYTNLTAKEITRLI